MGLEQFEMTDSQTVGILVGRIQSGKADVVEIRHGDELVAELRKPRAVPPGPPVGWIVAGHDYGDKELPKPFDSIDFYSNNIGASVWIHVSSGAMIAAIPTGEWSVPAQFKFYYAPPGGASAIPLEGWNADQELWTEDCGYTTRHDEAIAYFNATVGMSPAGG